MFIEKGEGSGPGSTLQNTLLYFASGSSATALAEDLKYSRGNWRFHAYTWYSPTNTVHSLNRQHPMFFKI